MASKVDMPLDEIIAKTRGFRGRRGRGRGRGARAVGRGRARGRGIRGGRSASAFRSPRGNINARWSHDMYYGGAQPLTWSISSGPVKLNISNLDYGVSDSDIKELFSEFGPMRGSAVHYDRSGRSLGTAHVIFERRADASKAIKQYHGVHLDRRPMNIVIDGESTAAVSVNGTRGTSFRTRGVARTKRLQSSPRPLMGGRGRLTRGVRGSRRGRGGRLSRGGRGGRQKIPTAEELDKELDEYIFNAAK